MNKRIFIDSSVIIEAMKGNSKAYELLSNFSSEHLCVSPTVFSEVVYIFIREKTRLPTEELRRSPETVKRVILSDIMDLILSCEILTEDEETVRLAFRVYREVWSPPERRSHTCHRKAKWMYSFDFGQDSGRGSREGGC